jgi:thymidine kinase
MYTQGRHSGWLEVISGPMFSGKTEELIRRLNLAIIAKQRVQIFKHAIDKRYDETYITSHTNMKFKAVPVSSSEEILAKLNDATRVVGIDEAQFFDDGIVEVCNKLANRGLRVIAAGLDQDFLGRPFGPMPHLLAIADSVLKLKAVCVVCGGEASKTQRRTENAERVLVGAGEHYEARCRACFDPEHILEKEMLAKPHAKEA